MYPHKANSLFSKSNCCTGQVLASKLTTVTQEMNKFELALGLVGVRAKEREGLYLGMF